MSTVATNHWLLCAFALAFRVFGPGMAWAWAIPVPARLGSGKPRRVLWTGSCTAFLGTVITLPLVLALAEAGIYTLKVELACLSIITAGGLALGLARYRKEIWYSLLMSLPALAVFVLSVVVTMLLDDRGEEIAGGWDPGTYLNQGVVIEREGTFRPPPDAAFSQLERDEFSVFSRQVGVFRAGLPVFPINPETRRFEYFFFRLTPGFIAMTARCGGLRLATRANHVAGILSLLTFMGLMVMILPRSMGPLMAGAFMCMQPVWLYHLSVPISEMLQLFLLCGVLALYAVRDHSTFRRTVVAIGLALLVINRFSFLPFGCMLLLVLAWNDLERTDRATVIQERVLQATALAYGVAFDMWSAGVTLVWLDFIGPALIRPSLIILFLVVLFEIVAAYPAGRTMLQRFVPLVLWSATLIAGVFVLLGEPAVLMSAFWQRAGLMVPFFGWPIVLAGISGILVMCLLPGSAGRLPKAYMSYGIAATCITLAVSAISPLYPWSTRRYLVYTVPLLSFAASVAISLLLDKVRSRAMVWKFAVGILALGVMFGNFGRARDAATRTEYNGLSSILADVAARVKDDEILVVDHYLYAVPMKFIYGKSVLNGGYLWNNPSPFDQSRALTALLRLAEQGRTIRFLTTSSRAMDVYPFRLSGIKADWSSGPVTVEDFRHGQSVDGFMLRDIETDFRLYSWVPHGSTDEEAYGWPTELDIDVGGERGTPYEGIQDDAYLINGFYACELAFGERTVRWTEGNSRVGLPVRNQGAGISIDIEYADERAAAAPPASPRFRFNGRLLPVASETKRGRFKLVSLNVPGELVHDAANALAIECEPWVPSDYDALTTDSRSLGIMIDRVRVYPADLPD